MAPIGSGARILTHSEKTANTTTQRPYRPPLGIPTTDGEDAAKGTIASVLIHLALILLLVLSSRTPAAELIFDNIPSGAGGINLPAGGGGGGTLGTGGRQTTPERALFIQIAPARPTKAPAPEIVKPEVKPPKVELIKPPEPEVPPPVVTPPTVDTKVIAAAVNAGSIDSSLIGRGGGSGNDGSAGNGPGRGGGIGSGDGTGTGSGTGPGTGGGNGNLYKPTPFFSGMIPPPPNKLRPLEVVVRFDVDVTGAVLGYTYNKSGDRGYDKELDAVFKAIRFRPAVDTLGRPIRASTTLTFLAK